MIRVWPLLLFSFINWVIIGLAWTKIFNEKFETFNNLLLTEAKALKSVAPTSINILSIGFNVILKYNVFPKYTSWSTLNILSHNISPSLTLILLLAPKFVLTE